MRKHLFVTSYFFMIFALMLFLLAFATSNSHAAETKIGVVNVQKIMREAKAAEAVRSQIKNKQKSFQEQLDKKESELQKEDQELAKQRSVLSQEAFEQKYREFRKKAADAQKEVRGKRSQLDKGFTSALAEIQKKVTEIVAAVCREKGLDMAVTATQVLYSDNTMDITAEVLSRLNSQMPNLNVNFN